CNLRMDDTNPAKEDVEYVDSITADVRWLIAGWADHCLGFKPKGATPTKQSFNGRDDYYLAPVDPSALSNRTSEISHSATPAAAEPFFASDYFDQLFDYAVTLIKKGKAYVDDLSPEETDAYRGAPDKPGRDSPFRTRSVEESLDLFHRMRAGEFPNGARSLRAKIDMASPNIWLRDPLLYRIRHTPHHHTGDKWCIYPLYDFAHCLSDYLEGVTHSICTVEFEVHRPLYDWILESLDLPRPLPRQYEFAKLIPSYMIVSKRRLIQLVNEKIVTGWDDPRMPTISGLRRRGIPASALRRFVIGTGVTKYDSLTDIAVFEHAIREELNAAAQRRLAVLRPIKVVLTNIPAGETIECDATNNPQDETPTTRKVALTREVFIESDDFAEVPPPKYFRLKPGGEVRLKYGCIIKLDEIVKDASGAIVELRCTADLTTRAGQPNSDRKVKGTIHWVSATHCIDAEVRLYDRLFTVPEPGATDDFLKHVNPNSLEIVTAKLESSLASATPGDRFQFERLGYFSPDPKDNAGGRLVFNRTITLKDTWAK
ncbi:MAG TPA: glutamine--tRNA ligase, partial [Opitutus sp.]|nr:glutamine--tRNA ligase [Opitutus sp.]